MPGHEIARKALVEGRIIILAGVILVSLFALVRVVGVLTGGIESSRQGQAEVMANMVVISTSTLSGVDAGRVTRDFTLSPGSEPMTVEIYDKGNGAMYVKITYDDKGNYYERPLLVSMGAVAPFKANSISVSKDITGNIAINGAIGGGWEWATTGDVPCTQPTKEKIMEYVNNAVNDPKVNRYGNVDATLVKGIIGVESQGLQCVKGHLNTNTKSGAAGLMQLLPSTAKWINEMFDLKLPPKNPENNPEYNVRLGTAYLSYLLNLFNGDRNRAIASYNCGDARIRCLAERYPSEWIKHLDEQCNKYLKEPRGACGEETQKYIVKVNNCMTACNQKECGIC